MIDESADRARKMEVLLGLEDVVRQNLPLLAPVDQVWQPTDFLPDLTKDDWAAQLTSFREGAVQLTDGMLVILVGGMITEEALPSYSVSLSLLEQDPTGTSPAPWAQWIRGWTAEENRHGDLLNAYLRLTGRVDMRAIEVTVQHLLRNGFDPKVYPDAYAALIYTAFQERATKITHGNVGKMAAQQGDAQLRQDLPADRR